MKALGWAAGVVTLVGLAAPAQAVDWRSIFGRDEGDYRYRYDPRRVAYDEGFRDEFQKDAQRILHEHGIEVTPQSLPEEITLPDPDAIRDFTQRCTDVLEIYVRRYPELWLWMHRRWRDADAKGEAVRGMFPAATGEEGQGP